MVYLISCDWLPVCDVKQISSLGMISRLTDHRSGVRWELCKCRRQELCGLREMLPGDFDSGSDINLGPTPRDIDRVQMSSCLTSSNWQGLLSSCRIRLAFATWIRPGTKVLSVVWMLMEMRIICKIVEMNKARANSSNTQRL